MAAERTKPGFVDRVERASHARFGDRPVYKIGDKLPLDPVPLIEDVWSVAGQTVVMVEGDSADPDFPLIEDAYTIARPDRAWFVVIVNPNVTSQERVRQYAGRHGFRAYWPRSIRLVRRGKGARQKEVPVVRPLFYRYVLVHLPATAAMDAQSRRVSPAFGLFTSHEARFNGVSDILSVAGHPLSVPDVLVERIIDRERNGEWNRTAKRGNKVVAVLPAWLRAGAMVKVANGPLGGFPGLVEEIDDVTRRVKLSVSLFGQATIAELDIADVAALC